MVTLIETEKFKTLLHASRQIRSWETAERKAVIEEDGDGIAEEVWMSYGGRVQDYDPTFSRVLSALHLRPLRELLVNRVGSGLSANVLDLMGGDASFLRDLTFPLNKRESPSPLDTGLCVTLVDERQERLRALDRRLRIEVLCCDLTSKSAWVVIDKKRREMGIDAFDLIVCRGVDAVAEDAVPRALYPFLFSKIWGRLSHEDGLFMTQLPKTVNSEEILEQLRSIPGIKLNFQPEGHTRAETYPTLGIIKTSIAPRSLT